MTSPEWLRRILLLSRADDRGKQPAELAELLDRPEEVLPYVVGAGGFADWPEARAALAMAVAGVPGAVRRSSGVRDMPAAWTYTPEREELIARMHEMVVAAGPPGLYAGEKVRPDAEDLIQLIHAQRRRHGTGKGPASFIGGLFAGETPREEPADGAVAGRANEAIGSLFRLLASRPAWWRLMPEQWRHTSLRQLAKRKGLFDDETYLARNPDVAAAGMDPLQHYMFHGCVEGRPL